MTPEEAIKALDELSENDPEASHQHADEIVFKVMKSNGLHDVADSYKNARDRIGFWYA